MLDIELKQQQLNEHVHLGFAIRKFGVKKEVSQLVVLLTAILLVVLLIVLLKISNTKEQQRVVIIAHSGSGHLVIGAEVKASALVICLISDVIFSFGFCNNSMMSLH